MDRAQISIYAKKCMRLYENLIELPLAIFPLYDYQNFDFDFA